MSTESNYPLYLVCREEKNIGTGGVHLVTLTRVNGLLLNRFDLKGFELLIKYLTLKTK